jgi:hypothetical protein
VLSTQENCLQKLPKKRLAPLISLETPIPLPCADVVVLLVSELLAHEARRPRVFDDFQRVQENGVWAKRNVYHTLARE